MTTKEFILTTLLFGSILPCCKEDEINLPIETDLLVSVRSDLGLKNNIYVIAETENIYECYNYRLNYFEQKYGKIYKIDFQNITVPEICLTAMGPAKAIINLGPLPNSEYYISFMLKGKLTNAILKVDSTPSIQVLQPGNVKSK